MEPMPEGLHPRELHPADSHLTSLAKDFDWTFRDKWQQDGACTQTFEASQRFQRVFDLEGEPKTKEIRRDLKEQEALAKAICRGCGLLEECFDYVTPRHNRLFSLGVWAGLSSRERKKLVKDEKNPIPQIKLPSLRVRGRDKSVGEAADPAA